LKITISDATEDLTFKSNQNHLGDIPVAKQFTVKDAFLPPSDCNPGIPNPGIPTIFANPESYT